MNEENGAILKRKKKIILPFNLDKKDIMMIWY